MVGAANGELVAARPELALEQVLDERGVHHRVRAAREALQHDVKDVPVEAELVVDLPQRVQLLVGQLGRQVQRCEQPHDLHVTHVVLLHGVEEAVEHAELLGRHLLEIGDVLARLDEVDAPHGRLGSVAHRRLAQGLGDHPDGLLHGLAALELLLDAFVVQVNVVPFHVVGRLGLGARHLHPQPELQLVRGLRVHDHRSAARVLDRVGRIHQAVRLVGQLLTLHYGLEAA
mmetsp:Transcript_10584/g.23496  ORF Transcript_10584/g.23496 Transcript_10584/m.23496 type:complete len:230 (-) Transcript_10584:1065-1754(-)